jgi:uncharacterized membrane protein YfcA
MVMFLLIVSVFVTSVVSGLTGLAGGAMLLGVLTLIYPPELALPFHSYTAFVSNLTRIFFYSKTIFKPVVWRYSLLIIPGTYLGGKVFDVSPPGMSEMIIGFMIIIGIYGLPFKFKNISFSLNGFIILGFFTGILGMLGGAVGPMLNPFFNKIHLNREQMISTKSACQLVLHCSRISTFMLLMSFDFRLYEKELILIASASMLGIFAATKIASKVSDQKINKTINVILVLIAIINIVKGAYKLLQI